MGYEKEWVQEDDKTDDELFIALLYLLHTD
jgi:hypothetical protein